MRSVKFENRKILPSAFVAGTLVLLSGCNMSTAFDSWGLPVNDDAPKIGSVEAQKKTEKLTSHATAFTPPESKSEERVSQAKKYGSSHQDLVLALREDFKPNENYYRETARIERTLSAQCRRILAETGIETAILRSPTISADVNHDGDIGTGISYDFVDIHRADLKEELALARCARRAALLKMSQLMLTTNQALTRSGFVAQADELKRSRGEFDRLTRRIDQAVNSGTITVQQAETLRQRMKLVTAVEARARAQAKRRDVAYRIMQRSFRKLDHDIIAAERRVADIQSRMRTADAFKIRGRAGYGRQAASETTVLGAGTNGQRDDFTANVQVSLRLGALSGRRYELENISADARVDEYYEADAGAVWRAKEQARVNRSTLRSLKDQRVELNRALRAAKRKTRAVISAYEDEVAMSQLFAGIDVLAIQAELAGVNRTIADTQRMDGKLNFRK